MVEVAREDATAAATPPGSERLARRLSPWMLGLAVLAFVLPFVSVSCATPRGYGSGGGGLALHYSGTTLAFGGDPTVEGVTVGAADIGPLSVESGRIPASESSLRGSL